MTDKRTVKMWDIVQALRANGIHAADCRGLGSTVLHPMCNCWVNPKQRLALVVNG